MARQKDNIIRKFFPFWEGVNAKVASSISKLSELSACENCRSDKIGELVKRQGTRRLGNSITATANYGVFYFENDSATNNNFYRISTVSSTTKIYYINTSAIWTALSGFGAGIFELGSSTTQFDITNPTGSTFRYTYDTTGTDPDIDNHIRVGTIVVINAQNFSAVNNGTFTVTGVSTNYFEVTNASGSAENNKTIGTGSITVTGNQFSTTVAESQLFLVNGDNDNMYIKGSDGSTVVTSTTNTGHLYNSPKARKINYYKDRLYLGDYTVGDTRYKNGIMMSSKPVGIVSLVDGDHTTPGADDWITVTDIKYIYATDTLDIYRGGTKIADVTIKAKKEDSIQINAISFASGTDLESSDEIWVDGTYTGTRVFRWADNPESGIDVKQYDTFKLTGNQNDRIKMIENIGDVMLIGNNNNIAVWNDYNLQNYDIGIGCVSDNGYVKALGVLFFIHYTGMYATTGSSAPQLLSNKVERYFSGASKAVLEAACLGRKGQSIFCGLSSTTLYNSDGSVEKTLSNVVLEYDLNTECWYVHTGIKTTQFCTYRKSTDADALEFASTETGYHIYEFLTGQLDDKVTSDKEICFRADTQEITLSNNFEEINYLLEIIIEVNRGSNIECFVSLDGESFYAIEGVARKGVNILKVTNKDGDREEPPRCRTVKLSFRDSSRKLCKLGKVSIKYARSEEVESPHNS